MRKRDGECSREEPVMKEGGKKRRREGVGGHRGVGVGLTGPGGDVRLAGRRLVTHAPAFDFLCFSYLSSLTLSDFLSLLSLSLFFFLLSYVEEDKLSVHVCGRGRGSSLITGERRGSSVPGDYVMLLL